MKCDSQADAPGLVDRRGGPDAVADAAHDRLGEVGEPAGDVAIAPAAEIGQRRRQLPVIERGRGFDAARKQAVDEPVVEIEPIRVRRAATLGQNTRPAGREAVDVELPAIADEVEILP
jgi:hypothetical protein